MLSAAYDLSAILDLPFSINLILHAFEKEKDQAAWDMWVSMYPFMAVNMLKPVNFNDFKTTLMQKHVRYSEKTDEEVMAEMMAVVAMHEGG